MLSQWRVLILRKWMMVCACELYVSRVLHTIVQLYVYLCQVRGTPKGTVENNLQKTILANVQTPDDSLRAPLMSRSVF